MLSGHCNLTPLIVWHHVGTEHEALSTPLLPIWGLEDLKIFIRFLGEITIKIDEGVLLRHFLARGCSVNAFWHPVGPTCKK